MAQRNGTDTFQRVLMSRFPLSQEPMDAVVRKALEWRTKP